jgi:UPF0755 protein
VRPGSSALHLLQQVVGTSAARLLAEGFPASAAGTGYSAYDVLIIASVIEREAIAPDFSRVSRVIYNRLAAGMPLQMDSTINYPLDRPAASTSDADRATLNPQPGTWRYFVKCQKDGASCFSVTREEHEAAVRDAAARGVF